MNVTSKILALFFLTFALGVGQLWTSEASAQSSYFTSRGCVNCHAAPTVATCAGCHQHSGTLAAATNKTTSYTPGETVTVTLTASGARSGWIGARLYNQSGAEIARSTGSQSGMGGSTIYPAVLSAPAPATAGTYTWRIAYLGNENGTGFGDVHSEKSVNVSITVASAADTTVPVVGVFTLPATATSLNVPVTTFTATDNVGVTGYLITTSATAPTSGWLASAQTSVTAVAGSNTFYAWARDAAGNVSLAKSASVTVTLPDTTVPVVSFTLPATATSLTVPVTTFTATDNVGVTGYLINKSATAPTSGWLASAPISVTAVAGSNTFYAWARDAAGNVSLAKSASVTVTIPPAADTTVPVVGAFTLPTTVTSLTVPVSSFTATDNVGVTGYLINKSATAPAATATGWTATAPTSVTAVAGSNTFYAYAKDAAGNVSLAKSASVTVTLPDTTVPVVSVFTLPATATSLNVPVTAFTATDNVGVTGYMITLSSTVPSATSTSWTASAQSNVTAAGSGTTTFYAWAKDAAGNVSLTKSASVSISLPDTAAPVVSAFSLPATATSLTVPVTAFTATDNVGVIGYLITMSATAPSASATGWTATAPASVTASASGLTLFYAWAKDAAGNVSLAKSASVTATITTADITKPTLTISALANGAYTNKATLNISGNASDAGGLQSVTVNGEAVVVNTDGSFSAALTLAVGANTVTVIATDKAGNQQSDIRTITSDPAAPVLTVSAPADNSSSAQSFITLTGTINETSTVTVTDNSGSPQAANIGGNNFTASVNLVPGVNTITITATDLAGNTTSAKRTVTYDSGNMTLAVTYPNQDITTSNSSLVLRGTIVDAVSNVTVEITMNGRTYTPQVVNGAFAQTLKFTRAQRYAITVTATNADGNSSSVSRNVIYRPERGRDRADD